jgi:GntR family transcriptional regulator
MRSSEVGTDASNPVACPSVVVPTTGCQPFLTAEPALDASCAALWFITPLMNRRSTGRIFDDRSPIYRQIADRIKAEVLSGTLAADAQVMSTNQYAAYYQINPATAAKAFQQLVDEGVLYKRRGIGMFVSPDAPEALRAQRRERFFTDVVGPMIAEANAVDIPLREVIRHIEAKEGK